jgi:hypothetical protein
MYGCFTRLEFLITRSKLPILWPRQIWSIFQNCERLLISKATFAPSGPCTIHFECLESGQNGSTRVRRLTCILRRAHVKIIVLAYGSFWFQLSGFSSYLTGLYGHHETKAAKPIWSCRSKYSNFYFKPSSRLQLYL